MKTYKQYINEKYLISNVEIAYKPTTRKELDKLIKKLIYERGQDADLNDIDVSQIEDFSNLFDGNKGRYLKKFDGNICNWDVSNVKDMSSMFHDSWFSGANGGIDNWNTSNVKNMSRMFWGNKKFDGIISSIGNWDVSKVENMERVFAWGLFKGDISKWNVSNVKNMTGMFQYNKGFSADISNWDVSNVETMYEMFCGSVFNGDISNWNISKVKDMSYMFSDAKKFTGNLSKWKPNPNAQMKDMFIRCIAACWPPDWYKEPKISKETSNKIIKIYNPAKIKKIYNTGEDIRRKLEYPGSYGEIDKSDFVFIKTFYTKRDSDGKFYVIHRPGDDYKYGRIAINPITWSWRELTMSEFYGNGVVD